MCQDENGLSSKERTARKLIDSGEANIQIIDEAEFLRLASTNKAALSPAGTGDGQMIYNTKPSPAGTGDGR